MHAAASIARTMRHLEILIFISGSKTDCLSISAWFRRGDVRITEAMNELCRAEFSAPRGCAHDAMAELCEPAHNVFGDGVFKQQAAIQRDFPAWGIGCGLRILPVVY